MNKKDKKKGGQQPEEEMVLVHVVCGYPVKPVGRGRYRCGGACGIISRGIVSRPASLVPPTFEEIQKEVEEELRNE